MTTPSPGAYFCVSEKDFVGALIRFGTRNHWNHAGIVIGMGTCFEARPKGAGRGHLDKYAKSDLITNSQEALTFAQRTAIVDKALSLDGIPYGFLDIVWLAIYGTLGVKWRWLERRVKDERRMICSQVVATCYKAAGIDLVPGKTPQEVTPGDLANRITLLNGGN